MESEEQDFDIVIDAAKPRPLLEAIDRAHEMITRGPLAGMIQLAFQDKANEIESLWEEQVVVYRDVNGHYVCDEQCSDLFAELCSDLMVVASGQCNPMRPAAQLLCAAISPLVWWMGILIDDDGTIKRWSRFSDLVHSESQEDYADGASEQSPSDYYEQNGLALNDLCHARYRWMEAYSQLEPGVDHSTKPSNKYDKGASVQALPKSNGDIKSRTRAVMRTEAAKWFGHDDWRQLANSMLAGATRYVKVSPGKRGRKYYFDMDQVSPQYKTDAAP